MSSVVISGDTSGTVSLTVPTVAGTNTATLPAATGTVMVSGNMPAFSAYGSSATSLTNAVTTKIQFQTEEFDTANAFDSTTNYRFTPQVAGYYQVNSLVGCNGNAEKVIFIYKNGSRFKDGSDITTAYTVSVSALVYLNGSTDYIEIYFVQYSGSTQNSYASAPNCYFQASMVRAA